MTFNPEAPTSSHENPYADKTTEALEEDLSIALDQYDVDNTEDLSDDDLNDISRLVNELRSRPDISSSGEERVERVAKKLNPQEIFDEDEEEIDLPVEDDE